jgi:DNA excision repair protein ERCC-6
MFVCIIISAIPQVLRRLARKPSTQGLVVITTYEGMRRYRSQLVCIEWSAVCLDEGQKIRNPATAITEACKLLPAYHRVLLSGTPIQNSLRELWSLFDFIYPGRLGSLFTFEQEFATPIRLGGYANANALQFEIAIRCASTLQRIVKPYLLRRKKDDLIDVTRLPPKTEQVLFCQISPRQRSIYNSILESSEVQAVLRHRMMAFRAINTLRKLCNHPALVFQNGKVVWNKLPPLSERRMLDLERGDNDSDEGNTGQIDDDGEEADDIIAKSLLNKSGSAGLVWADSGKLLVLSKVLPLWQTEGHKVLIFSQTRGMLSIIESMVRELGFLYLRLDGCTPVGKRAGIVNKFNSNPRIFVMLLTTRTGGVGISLTAANRVVLFDPDWNPMTDMQSRERAWRLGQQR